MNNLNSVLIEGNMVRDPLFRATPKGTPLCTFTLASNRYYRQDSQPEQEVGFFEVETWTKLAENCYHLGHKGRGVRVIGRLKQDRWISADGKNHSRVTIVAEHVEFKPDFKRNIEKAEESGGIAASITEEALVKAAAEAEEAEFSVPIQDDPVEVEEYEAVSF